MQENQTASDRKNNRNIVDMLRDDQASGLKKNWKVFRDKLCLKRTGKAWTSSVPIPASDIRIQVSNFALFPFVSAEILESVSDL
ncbi:hypothetical protein L1987_38814 [Smallanthus sonchifolius]|uniref:Uncharacterized protein n=1 Tax=Smallanthus sonchifolius TaxID=185202 RepID=A0ACB9HJP1_9ASTR|nr:hypothetical protein L1987_38814 [Smallanthus sonchifolius]